ncbi:MAG: four helix bundle protein, partial [Myxococcales bacterium]|nr:four helix bundle protein [Myxococcales bacterium]
AAVEIAALADDATAEAADAVIVSADRLYALLTGLIR